MSAQSASEALYECPEFSVNETSFGPCSVLRQFEDLPFGLFSPDDNLGMIVDITQPSIVAKHTSMLIGHNFYRIAIAGDGEEGAFTVVDNTRSYNAHKPKSRKLTSVVSYS